MFELSSPWVLLILPLPFLVWILRATNQSLKALKLPFFHALVLNVVKNKSLHRPSSLFLPFLIWTLLVFSASGPCWIGKPQTFSREGYNIMMALDLSESMEIRDMLKQNQPVSRLTVVKDAAKQFINARPADKIGLIVFGSQAYLQTPLTQDKQSLLLRIEDATVGLAGQTTSLGDALGLAIKRLQDVPKKGRMIILLTDGANNSGVLSPLKAAELAKTQGIKVYTIGLGAEAGLSGFLSQVSADLDEDTLKKVAEMTGGRYFRATDTGSLQTIYHTIHQMETVKQEQTTLTPQQQLYPWVLACTLALFFYWLLSPIYLRSMQTW